MKTVNLVALAVVVILATSPAVARTDQYLISTTTEKSLHVTEVMYQPDGAKVQSTIFDDRGGVLALAEGEVRGTNLQGEDVAILLTGIKWIRANYRAMGQTSYVALRLDAVLGLPSWPPDGRIVRLAVHGGTIIEFEDTAPELQLETQELVWPGSEECEVRLPLPRVLWVEFYRPDTYVVGTEPTPAGALAAVVLRSGETVDLLGRHGCLDVAEGRVWCSEPAWAMPLSEVRNLLVGVAPEVVPPPVLSLGGASSESLNNLSRGQRVRIKAGSRDADWMTGNFAGYQDGEIFLRTEGDSSVTMAEDEVYDFQVSEGRRNNSGTGAIVGGSIGGVFCAVAAGAAAASFNIGLGSSSASDEEIASAAVMGFMVGALGGGLLGALVGSASSSEHFTDLEDFDNPRPTDGPDDEWLVGYAITF